MRGSRGWELAGAGALVVAGHAAFLFVEPFNKNVPAFLFIYTVLCLVLALFSWRERRQPSPQGDFRREAWTVVGVAVVLRAILFSTDPTLSDDVFRYVWDGRVQLAGLNPYRLPPASPDLAFLRDAYHPYINHPTVHTIYPPLTQFVFRAAAAVRPTVEMQKLVFTIFDLAAIGVLLALLRARKMPAIWAALYAWHPLPSVEFAGSGHLDSLMLFALLGGCWLAGQGRLVAAGGAFGVAVVTKWIPVAMTPWILLRTRWKSAAAYAIAAVVLSLPFAWGFLTRSGELLPATSGARAFARDWVFNPSLYSWAEAVIASPLHRRIFFGGALVAFSFWWAKRNADPARYLHGALFALLLASPVVHPWYVLWLLPFAVLTGSAVSFVWAWLAAFTYVVQIRYATEGVWMLPAWVGVVEYGVLYSLLAFVGLRALKPAKAAPRPLPPMARPRAAVIIPALNEEKAIGLVIADIPKEFVAEVIVVDNGSSDRTRDVARAAGARVLDEPRRGYGRAVQRGLNNLSSDVDVVVILDGDRSDFPEELPRLLEPIQNGTAAMVIGSRVKAALPGSLMPQQRFGNWLTCFLIEALYDFRFTDMGPFRAIRRDAIEEMKMVDPNFGWNVEMQVKALQKGFPCVEVPVKYRPRIGQSKISGTLRGSFNAGRIILWAIWHYGVRGASRPATR